MLARSGLITADITHTNNGILVNAPLCFDEDIVMDEGSVLIDTNDVHEALGEVYLAYYDAWCDRKSPARAIAINRSTVPLMSVHTPCPALWAGR